MSSLKQSVSLILQTLLVLVFFLFNMKPPMITWYNTSICFCLFWHSYFYFFSERFTIGKKNVFYLVKRIASCLKWHHLDYDLVLRQCVCVYTHRCVCMCMRVCVYVCVCVCVIQCCKVTVPRNVQWACALFWPYAPVLTDGVWRGIKLLNLKAIVDRAVDICTRRYT